MVDVVGRSAGRVQGPPGPSVQELLDQEVNPVPEVLRRASFVDLGTEDIPYARSYAPEYHDREVEKVWRKVWQFACRAEDIRNVGDHVVYDVADDSYIVVRSEPGVIKAFHNVCLHRGTTLRDRSGSVPEFRCPFHAFTWNLDGSVKHIPCEWDFEHIEEDSFGLREVNVATWGGFVFVNADRSSEPLETYLEDLPEHFARWPMEKRYKVAHTTKVMPCNWKTCQDAFSEAYHVMALHPEDRYYVGDINSEADIYPGRRHYSRMITPLAVPSPSLGDNWDDEAVIEAAQNVWGDSPWGELPIGELEATTPRQAVAAATRQRLSQITGVDLTGITDCEALDGIIYSVFPNIQIWAGLGSSLVLRWRPNGSDPDTCLMDTIVLAPFPDGAEPPTTTPTSLALEQPWSDAPEMGGLSRVWQQDTDNLRNVQRGQRASKKPGITLSTYMECRLRHFNQTLDSYLDA